MRPIGKRFHNTKGDIIAYLQPVEGMIKGQDRMKAGKWLTIEKWKFVDFQFNFCRK